MSRYDKATLPLETIAKRVRMQVLARLAPHRFNLPRDWKPRTDFDRHIKRLMEAGHGPVERHV